MSIEIYPAIGRQLYYHPGPTDVEMAAKGRQGPLPAMVLTVRSATLVDLRVFGPLERDHYRPRVQLVQPGEQVPEGVAWAEWPPAVAAQEIMRLTEAEELKEKVRESREVPDTETTPEQAEALETGKAMARAMGEELERTLDESQGYVTILPADFPAREALSAAGFDTVESVREEIAAGGDLTDLKGIGPKTFDQIREALA